jgi:hypothetical protein
MWCWACLRKHSVGQARSCGTGCRPVKRVCMMHRDMHITATRQARAHAKITCRTRHARGSTHLMLLEVAQAGYLWAAGRYTRTAKMSGLHIHTALRSTSISVWSAFRSCFENGLLFLSEDIASLVDACPGSSALYGALPSPLSCHDDVENKHLHSCLRGDRCS